jgi:hypothetical protein
MNLELYPFLTNNEFQEYSFYSDGPKGKIKKTVVYTKINDDPIIYNLAFGDEDPNTGLISDNIISNNEDRDIVLATVANTINTFTDHYGNNLIYATGSTPARTRLYQISITKLLDEISLDFDVYGIIDDEVFPFNRNVNYEAFLVRKR